MNLSKSKSHFKSPSSILAELREASTHEGTVQLLAEVFFEYALHEMENDPPNPERIRQLRNLYFDTFRLFELARQAKELGK
jgi:hypothetical protein